LTLKLFSKAIIPDCLTLLIEKPNSEKRLQENIFAKHHEDNNVWKKNGSTELENHAIRQLTNLKS